MLAFIIIILYNYSLGKMLKEKEHFIDYVQ